MRLCTFLDAGRTRLGRVDGDVVQPLDGRDVRDAFAAVPVLIVYLMFQRYFVQGAFAGAVKG